MDHQITNVILNSMTKEQLIQLIYSLVNRINHLMGETNQNNNKDITPKLFSNSKK